MSEQEQSPSQFVVRITVDTSGLSLEEMKGLHSLVISEASSSFQEEDISITQDVRPDSITTVISFDVMKTLEKNGLTLQDALHPA